jgi:hypothetical protein
MSADTDVRSVDGTPGGRATGDVMRGLALLQVSAHRRSARHRSAIPPEVPEDWMPLGLQVVYGGPAATADLGTEPQTSDRSDEGVAFLPIWHPAPG